MFLRLFKSGRIRDLLSGGSIDKPAAYVNRCVTHKIRDEIRLGLNGGIQVFLESELNGGAFTLDRIASRHFRRPKDEIEFEDLVEFLTHMFSGHKLEPAVAVLLGESTSQDVAAELGVAVRTVNIWTAELKRTIRENTILSGLFVRR